MTGDNPFSAPDARPEPIRRGPTSALAVGLRRLVVWQLGAGAWAVLGGGVQLARLGWALPDQAAGIERPEQWIVLGTALTLFATTALALLAVGMVLSATAIRSLNADFDKPAHQARGLAAQRRIWMVSAMGSVATLGVAALAAVVLLATVGTSLAPVIAPMLGIRTW